MGLWLRHEFCVTHYFSALHGRPEAGLSLVQPEHSVSQSPAPRRPDGLSAPAQFRPGKFWFQEAWAHCILRRLEETDLTLSELLSAHRVFWKESLFPERPESPSLQRPEPAGRDRATQIEVHFQKTQRNSSKKCERERERESHHCCSGSMPMLQTPGRGVTETISSMIVPPLKSLRRGGWHRTAKSCRLAWARCIAPFVP